MNIWLEPNEPQTFRELRLHASDKERILLDFQPLKESAEPDWNPMPEEWSCYYAPLRIYKQDYALLLPYFARIYPTVDAFDGTPELSFDVCFSNWIGKRDWKTVMHAIRQDISAYTEHEQLFFGAFLKWLEEALEHTNIIVVIGNQ